jgi:ABC-type polysaccharide/polyol phosphate export permease
MTHSLVSQDALAFRDMTDAVRQPQLWLLLGWQDIKQRYRRSILGPFWLTISTAVMVVALGLLYAAIFQSPLDKYLPYLATGLVIWMFLSGTVSEGCQTFIASDGIIKQVRAPFLAHVLRVIWRNLIILGHNLIIVLAVIVIFPPDAQPIAFLLVVPAVFLLVLNAGWVVLSLGMFSARFRDVPPIVMNVMQLLFFLTPIIWDVTALPGRESFVYWNPLYHFVEVLRAPLLGGVPTAATWTTMAVACLFGWFATFLLFRRYRSRIAYWL